MKPFRLQRSEGSNTVCIIFSLLVFTANAWADRYDDVVTSERLEHDFKRDELREPGRVLREIGVVAGATVLDIGAGDGYYTEMLSRLVGPEGHVYLQNPAVIYQRFGDETVVTRLADGRLGNVTRWDHEMTDLQLPESTVDLAFAHLFYHDLFWINEDMERVNREIWKSLKPGGRLVIIDHAAPAGSGAEHALNSKGIHRIDGSFVEASLEKEGFELTVKSEILRIPNDDRSLPFFSPELRGKKTDRFFYLFKKVKN